MTRRKFDKDQLELHDLKVSVNVKRGMTKGMKQKFDKDQLELLDLKVSVNLNRRTGKGQKSQGESSTKTN